MDRGGVHHRWTRPQRRGPGCHPWNILAFFLGTVAFFIWTVRVANKPQMAVNVVALGLGALGLVKSMT